ncbi:hypothetical protein G9F72_008905 [Clostridium estertheticum]|uniref:hypothetical protein n=1 Tax=Clostridium estertheticum TaxID=238834 RepID=UPI0013E916B3|nr:hypothetical protein [Clostridium estertheticum]MBZ9686447.1 hypothetical protein [Clostridium estertheticum]
MDTNIIIKLLLLLVPAGLFLYFDEKLLISNKVQAKFKITNFLGLFAFITISLVLSAIVVATISIVLHISNAFTYGLQSILMGLLLGLFSNIQKKIRRKKGK